MVWPRKRSKQQRRAPRRKAPEAERRVDIRAAAVTAVRAAKAVRGADMVVRAGTPDQAVQAEVREDHAVASGNISARRKFASSVSRRWT
jgi:hypothetical protein